MSTSAGGAETLFSAFTIRGLTIPNRIVMSPMCMYTSGGDGRPTDWHVVHLGSRAAGGTGLVFTEATAVSADGRITPGDLGIWSDEHVDGHRRLTAAVAAHGAVPGIQIAHAGRKGGRTRPWEGNRPLPREAWGQVLAPSAEPFKPDWHLPTAMTTSDIEGIVSDFSVAARRAHEAGYRVLEGHFAHGYLMHQFLSPLANRRTDRYGGSLENRARLPLAVARAMRQAWPDDLPLFIRLSMIDWLPGGISLDETVQVASWMRDEGVDLIDGTSSGILPGEAIPEEPLYHLGMAGEVRRRARIATSAVGRVRTTSEACEALRSGNADLVFIGRAILQDAYWARRAERELGAENLVGVPVQYRRATQHLL
ncbi:NADH:flavin oxidoreductase/NADH oxidase [Microbacterium immunditiarum]|uniref:2,4-dienoyl-CoA reductase-like NADH-dependent reductase (Old Yellow Enzyme family) n=1 Tax=Microbacterium immunditiarum TaxID=337480 RepID=A0A7Y9GR36_9MICO|nr:2,4-dienoyl-CoA reductase-like NADH-dependent reductase (Old Yellow Enzyme family) [Microbacterium immunditiarum]